MTNEQTPDRAGVIAFPPLLFGSTLAVGLLLSFVFPTPWLRGSVALITGAVLVILAVTTLLLAFRGLIDHKTTIHPGGSTTAIVSTGVYQYSRNPMYLSLTLIYGGVSLMASAFWGLQTRVRRWL